MGNLYIADALNNRIRRHDPATGIISHYIGTGAGSVSGDGGDKDLASVRPTDLEFDAMPGTR